MSSNPSKSSHSKKQPATSSAASQAKQFSKSKKAAGKAKVVNIANSPPALTPHAAAYQSLYSLSSLQAASSAATSKAQAQAAAAAAAAAAKAQAQATAAKAQAPSASTKGKGKAPASAVPFGVENNIDLAEQAKLLNMFSKQKAAQNKAKADAVAKAQATAQAHAQQQALLNHFKQLKMAQNKAKAQAAAQAQAISFESQKSKTASAIAKAQQLKAAQAQAAAAQAQTAAQAQAAAAQAQTAAQAQAAAAQAQPNPDLAKAIQQHADAAQEIIRARARAQAAHAAEAQALATLPQEKNRTAAQQQHFNELVSEREEADFAINLAGRELEQAKTKLTIQRAIAVAPKSHGMRPITIEYQDNLKCGQHTLNNLLQNDKIKFVSDFANPGVLMPNPGCINLMYFCDKFKHLLVNPSDLCNFKTGYYDITILDAALKMLNIHTDLNFDMDLITPGKQVEFTKIIRNPKLIGFIVNKPGHWYAVVKRLPHDVIDAEGINSSDKVIVIDSQKSKYIPLDIPGLIKYLNGTVSMYVVTLQ
jgi:hypothetical protein